MNYRSKLEKLGCEIKQTYMLRRNKITNISYTIKLKNKSYSFKTLKEAYNLIDLF